ncbi:LysR family transcriptional regulator ArgP [Paludibacterium purpuratum]|uniref:LysR family transcriptional regulator n=1 Tax=Paludibacterium purpuratum TaxID=1144873 RepID=A0A4R7BA95_9NEIS|nr:LysR family transcriptional regulator ArgP [Paludibacterium purpuratum]TDR81503.1 LysR family transcriptional regulator [Paludibacterium purpuratum]
MQFDWRKGEALLAVLATGSFERAAAQLHLTASAISQRVRALEDEIGQPLIVRTRPCLPTPAGRKILLYLQRSRLLEQEWRAEMAREDEGWLSVPLAVNHDSMATWLLPALGDCLQRERILLDITLDDQSHTQALMEAGRAVAGIASQPDTLRGCRAEWLGAMRYRLAASPAFMARWFADGFTRQAAQRAPLAVFDRKDLLQWQILQQVFALTPESLSCHYLPSSEAFMRAIEQGLCYGLLPELQAADAFAQGRLIDLLPGRPLDVPLWWHCWNLQTPRLERLTQAVCTGARACLLP